MSEQQLLTQTQNQIHRYINAKVKTLVELDSDESDVKNLNPEESISRLYGCAQYSSEAAFEESKRHVDSVFRKVDEYLAKA